MKCACLIILFLIWFFSLKKEFFSVWKYVCETFQLALASWSEQIQNFELVQIGK